MSQNNVLEKIKGGLIVSCQARKGWPMYGTEIMVAFAKAAEQGGACGIRATEPQNIQAIKKAVDLPMIGIFKQWYTDYEVYITPTYESAAAVIEAGADIVAMDGTQRKRPNDEALKSIIERIHKNYPEILVMADCDHLESGKYAQECGADIVSTTMAGYTEAT
ncbi:MAG: putative N-acetylmannosamine-6-phosphate 2-epimerase, partial [Tetragenococcus koreensis]|nr:putative N-acetylmannosamine-6-phosphate 2-epimerase [Tetragenococcus koreensis]